MEGSFISHEEGSNPNMMMTLQQVPSGRGKFNSGLGDKAVSLRASLPSLPGAIGATQTAVLSLACGR